MESFLYIISCLLLEIVWRCILLITNQAKFACVCNVDFEVLPYEQKVWFSTRNFWIAMFPVKVLNKPSVLFFCLFACFAFFLSLFFFFIKFLDSLAHKVLETCFVKWKSKLSLLTLSRRRPLSYRNQSIDLRSKSMDWTLYDNALRIERVK